MSYVDKTLIPGEQVLYRGTPQRFQYLAAVPPALVCIYAIGNKFWVLAAGAGFVVVATLVGTWLRLASCEFAVTNKRVIVKVGAINRRTVELMLTKVEGISVDQTLVGRIANYGTVIVNGTGGTREAFDGIVDRSSSGGRSRPSSRGWTTSSCRHSAGRQPARFDR
jgi:uncharacterized membrane protein YdbT with pleckstrin-like domain